MVHPQRRRHQPRRVRRRPLRRGAHGPRRPHVGRHPPPRLADVHRHDGDRPAAAEARRRRLPGRDRRLPAGRRRPRGRRRAAARRAREARRVRQARAHRRRRLRPARAGRRPRPRRRQHGRGDATTPTCSATARASCTPPASTTPHRVANAMVRRRAEGRARSPAARRRASSRTPSRPTSAARSTCSSTRSCWPRAGTPRARRSACTSRRRPAAASTSSASGRIMRLHRRKEAGVVVDFVEELAPAHRPHRDGALAAGRRPVPARRAGHAALAAGAGSAGGGAAKPLVTREAAGSSPSRPTREARRRIIEQDWKTIAIDRLPPDEQEHWAEHAALRVQQKDLAEARPRCC